MAGISLAQGSLLESYVSNANDVVYFKMIREEKDIDDEDLCFSPEFTHQFFGDSESIFGYSNLRVNIYYSASRLSTYISLSYTDRVDPKKSGGVQPDNVQKIIQEKLEFDFGTNVDDFVASLSKESTFRPHGVLIQSFTVEGEENSKQTFEVYRADMSVLGFQQYHQRMQTFILWFIDAASFIEVDDERWEYFTIFERVVTNGDPQFFFVGYATVYRYYAYPTRVRPRISQMFILPNFQKKGLGARMLEAMYSWYIRDPDVLDITVEDPSENFVRLRDFVDCKNCLQLASFQPEKLAKGFTEEMFREAQEKFKIGKKQARRVFEILRLRITNIHNEKEYRSYRLDVKNRLNAPHQRQKLDLEKLQKTLSADELKATLTYANKEQRIEQLDHQYKDIEAEYKQVIGRLSS